jgi:hypothetical protein
MAKRKKYTIQVSVWSDNPAAVAAYINSLALSAAAAFGAENQHVVFSGPGVKAVRAAVDTLDWKSANVSGRMRMT